VPVDALFSPQMALISLADTLSEAFFIMIRLGSPFIAYAILVNLAIGLINKLTPQIPIYFVALPFVIAGALIMMYFAIAPMLGLHRRRLPSRRRSDDDT
jgi:flagellar biosynthesis protein FliR